MDWEKRIRNMVTQAATAGTTTAQEMVAQGLTINLRLFYRPATATQDGALFLCEQGKEPQGAVLGCDDRFHGGIPYDNYWPWIRQRVGSLPLLATQQ